MVLTFCDVDMKAWVISSYTSPEWSYQKPSISSCCLILPQAAEVYAVDARSHWCLQSTQTVEMIFLETC